MSLFWRRKIGTRERRGCAHNQTFQAGAAKLPGLFSVLRHSGVRALYINEVPRIDVHIVDSAEAPGGMGEPGTSALPPAIVNAIFAATGVRIRKLPIGKVTVKAG